MAEFSPSMESEDDDWFDSEDFETGSNCEEEAKEDDSMELNDRKPRGTARKIQFIEYTEQPMIVIN